MFDRDQLTNNLTGYLQGSISRDQLREYMLGVVTASSYEQAAAQDPLVKETVEAVMAVFHKAVFPSKKMLEYYRRCLAGELTYQPPQSRDLRSLGIPDFEEDEIDLTQESVRKVTETKERPGKRRDFSRLAKRTRIYTLLFAFGLLAMHVVALVAPQLMGYFDDEIPFKEIAMEAAPHLFYAVCLLLPLRWWVKRFIFPVGILIFIWGTLFYWYLTLGLVIKYSLPLMMSPIVFFLCGFPATAALFLLFAERRKLSLLRANAPAVSS